MRRSRRQKSRSNAALKRLLSASTRGWVLDPILSEREEWSECVHSKKTHDEDNEDRNAAGDESADEFED